jgi:uncharacterized protein (TIGR02001 family)
MKHFSKTLLAGSLLASAFAVQAAEPVTGNVALTSNYIWRGTSQTAQSSAIQGGFDYAHDSGFYVGTWGSNVNFGFAAPYAADAGGANMELDLYGGYKFTAAGIGWDVGVLQYLYPGADKDAEIDFLEYYIGGSYGPFSVKYFYAGDYQGNLTDKSASYLDLAANFDLGGVGLGLHYGMSSGDGIKEAFGDTYNDYKISLSKAVGTYTFGIAYSATDMDPEIKAKLFNSEGQFFVTVSKAL